MQDMEFTIERGKLYMLQTRNGKRTPQAGIKIAVALVDEGLMHQAGGPAEDRAPLSGRAAAPRLRRQKALAAAARRHRSARLSRSRLRRRVLHRRGRREAWAKDGPVSSGPPETSPEDINGMRVSQGILTARGGMTSHAAVVARGMGTCCVPAAPRCISTRKKQLTSGGNVVKEGDIISIDGSPAMCIWAASPPWKPRSAGEFATIMQWADEFRALRVRTNADTPHDAATAVKFGARASACAVPSICSSRLSASPPCAR
jgi:pyruvate,orthophosphate dikinase